MFKSIILLALLVLSSVCLNICAEEKILDQSEYQMVVTEKIEPEPETNVAIEDTHATLEIPECVCAKSTIKPVVNGKKSPEQSTNKSPKKVATPSTTTVDTVVDKKSDKKFKVITITIPVDAANEADLDENAQLEASQIKVVAKEAKSESTDEEANEESEAPAATESKEVEQENAPKSKESKNDSKEASKKTKLEKKRSKRATKEQSKERPKGKRGYRYKGKK